MTPQEAQRHMQGKTLKELAFQLQTQDVGTGYHRAATAELIRRQAEAQIDAANAQCRAADATEAAAAYTQKSTRYILWSVWG